MSGQIKYPRTPHLPWSPGVTRDDRVISTLEPLLEREILVTEKLDGSNVCFTKDNLYSRGGLATHHQFDWLKGWHASVKHLLSAGVHYYAEYCYAVHSIVYKGLFHYVNLIAVRSEYEPGWGDVWWTWEETRRVADILSIPTVPVIGAMQKASSEEALKGILTPLTQFPSVYGGPREGVVVRYPGYIRCKDQFDTLVAKWVREGHVQTDQHWANRPIEKQRLESDPKPVTFIDVPEPESNEEP